MANDKGHDGPTMHAVDMDRDAVIAGAERIMSEWEGDQLQILELLTAMDGEKAIKTVMTLVTWMMPGFVGMKRTIEGLRHAAHEHDINTIMVFCKLSGVVVLTDGKGHEEECPCCVAETEVVRRAVEIATERATEAGLA